jgi:hypothetical protein
MNHFLLYATANDKKNYLEDIINFYNLARYDTGVGKVKMYVAISEVNTPNHRDFRLIENIKKCFVNHPWIDLKSIFFKSNLGRDFSSYQQLVGKASGISNSIDDYVFFRNRSARGPFEDGWFLRFINQFEVFDNNAICGNTINMYSKNTHISDIVPHVQSYAFMSTMRYLNMLKGEFPGINETTRLNVIANGEIALSQFFLIKGLKITSLNEKQVSIGNELNNEIRSKTNINPKCQLSAGLPFYHYQDIRMRDKVLSFFKIDAINPLLWFYK